MTFVLPLWIEYMVLGAFGALCSYLIKQLRDGGEWKIVLPKYDGESLHLGVLIYIILGSAAGWLAPFFIGNSINSFLAGYFFISIFGAIEKQSPLLTLDG